ncbi:hypothetical protein ACFPPD_00960 [Cohnella suwonensis]|uniref:Uncharacterized protein n=1 Tax=Cohnella suwonensis TaxID=696072 RepID=A0ABW0LNI9_9BACL
MRRWLLTLVLLILSVSFTVMMDLLLGFKLQTSTDSILRHFLFMSNSEMVVAALTILYVGTMEIIKGVYKK